MQRHGYCQARRTLRARTTVTYTVEDEDGDTDSTTFDIVVSAADVAATATINTSAQTIDGGADLVLDATVGGNTPLTVLWSATGGTFDDTAATDPTWTAPTPDDETDYTLTLSVDDDDGDMASATVEITVRGDPRVSLFDESVTNDTTGVVWLSDRFSGGQSQGVAFILNSAFGNDNVVDPDYIVNGGPAFVSRFTVGPSGTVVYLHHSGSGTAGVTPGPHLTADALTNVGLTFKADDMTFKWRLSVLSLDDDTEPYNWISATVTAAERDAIAAKQRLFGQSS